MTESLADSRSWTFDVFGPIFSENGRYVPMQRARLAEKWRKIGGWLARGHSIPHMNRARIDVVWVPSRRGRHDPSNATPAVKALVDGMVTDAGILDDDDSTRLDGPYVTLATVPGRVQKGHWWLRVTVTEVTP